MTTTTKNSIAIIIAIITLLHPPIHKTTQTITHAFSQNINAASRVFVSTPAKLPRRLVKDCMTPRSQLKTLTPETTIDEAIELFLSNGISGAPVISSKDSSVLGIVSSSDFLIKEDGGSLLPMEGTAETVEGYVAAARRIMATTVEEVMTTRGDGLTTIRGEVSMKSAVDLMARERLHRLLVVDGEGELMGVLSRSDVMRDVLEGARAALPEAKEEN